MLNIQNTYPNYGEEKMIFDQNNQISLDAKFCVKNNQDSNELTSLGFHYVLLDTPVQVHILLRKYIEQQDDKNVKKDPEDNEAESRTIEIIKLIFYLALVE